MMNEEIAREVAAVQETIREQVPEARFKLEPPEDAKDPWTLYVYTPTGNMQMPGNIMGQLDDISRRHRTTVVAVMYPLGLYDEQE